MKTRSTQLVLLLACVVAAIAASARAQTTVDPIVYTVRVPEPETHVLEVDATIPTGGRADVDLMMPVWSPGYYRVEPCADRATTVMLSYHVFCNERTVTTRYTADEFRSTAEEIAGIDLREWSRTSVSTAAELDYIDLLECFGLQFAGSDGDRWTLEPRPSATDAQRRRRDAWLAPSSVK